MKKQRVQHKFLEELRKIPIVQVACERVGISRQSIYRWRTEDSEFRHEMDTALDEGEELLNDLCESQLLALVKDKHFQAIKYRLEKRHPKYQKPVPTEPSKKPNIDVDEVIEALELIPEDLTEENCHDTMVRVAKYLDENDLI